jgi:hypothetical protein
MIVLVPMVVMIVAAAAGIAMVTVVMIVVMVPMGVIVRVFVPVRMVVMMVRVIMAMMMIVPMVVIADMSAALRPEGTFHRGGGAALPAGQFGERRVVLDVERLARDFDQTVMAAEMPGEPHQAKRVLGLHLQEPLRCGLHLHQIAVFQPQGVAVVEGGLHVEVEQDLGAALAFQGSLAAVPRLVIQGHRVDDTVGLHGGLADDGGNAGHGFVSVIAERNR